MKKTICLLLSVILFLLCAAVPAAAEAAEYEVTFSLAGCEPLNRDMLAYPGNKVREGVRVFIGTKNADLPAGKYIRSFSSDPAGVGFLPMEDCFTFEMPSNDVTISAELGNRTAAEIDLSGEAAVSINWFLYRALLTFYDSTLTGTGAGYFFIDVNNDGNDDLMLYGEDGKVTAERMKTGADLIKNPVEISLTKANAGENVYAQVPYTAVKLIFTKQPAQEPEPAVYTVTVTDDGNGTGAADPKSGVTGTVVKLT